MTTSLTLLAGLAPLAFAAVALRRRPAAEVGAVVRGGQVASWVGLAVAGGAGLAVALRGPLQTPTLGLDGLGLSLRLDALSAIVLAMVAVLALVIVRFSATYLDGDPRQATFLRRLAATIAAVEVLVLSGNLGLLVLAWVATSLALHGLLRFYPDRPGAVVAARKKFLAARAGDVLLVAAVALVWVELGTGDIGRLLAEAPAAIAAEGLVGPLSVAALCLVGAAALKSAQFPTHGWLVEVMETPTPVSALLHAGILNAGPFLVIRLAGVVDGAELATAALIAIGGTTAVFASVSLLTQPAVKAQLGYSSVAHMGFMLMVCGLGFYAAALLHLVAHSFYKAHAFLASGSVIDLARAHHVRIPPRLGRPARIAGAFALAAGLYLGLALLWGQRVWEEPGLLAIGAVLVLGLAQILAPAIDSAAPPRALRRPVLYAVGVALAFFTLETGAHVVMDRTLPEVAARELGHGLLAAGVLATFATVVVLQVVEPTRPPSARRRALAVHLRNGLYANAVLDRLVGALRTRPSASASPASAATPAPSAT